MQRPSTVPPDRGAGRAEARGSSGDSHPNTASETGAPPLAVILAAGEGARLAGHQGATSKPALQLLGLSLAERTVSSCIAADLDCDNDVDFDDFVEFHAAFTGPLP
jgi:hypothetical protein